MQKMLFRKSENSDPEIVWMLNAYRGHDGKLKAVIMRKDPDAVPNGWDTFPYEEVELSRLRPLPKDYNKVFCL